MDEVPAGAFTIACHATVYKLPTNMLITITETESLQLNFELEPEVGEEATYVVPLITIPGGKSCPGFIM